MITARKQGWFYCPCYCAPRPQLGLESHCARHCPNTEEGTILTPRSAVLINLYLFVQLLVYYYAQSFALEGKCSQFWNNELSVMIKSQALHRGNVETFFSFSWVPHRSFRFSGNLGELQSWPMKARVTQNSWQSLGNLHPRITCTTAMWDNSRAGTNSIPNPKLVLLW